MQSRTAHNDDESTLSSIEGQKRHGARLKLFEIFIDPPDHIVDQNGRTHITNDDANLLAAGLEKEVFDMYSNDTHGYYGKLVQIRNSLLKNARLWSRVASQEITAAEVVMKMTEELF